MKHLLYIIFIALFSIIIGLSSCSDSENRYLAGLNMARVVIDLGLPQEQVSTGILDRFLRLFARDAVAQTPPAVFGSITVRVTGADIGVIENSFSPLETISLNVPSGELRSFEVTAYAAPGDPSGVASFRGVSLASLPAGQTVSVPVEMKLYESKIVVPDYANFRVVTLDNIFSTSWTVGIYDTCGECRHQIYDVDFDARGRIYASSYYSGQYEIVRFDNINLVNPQSIIPVNIITADTIIAIDRIRNYLYFSDGTDLYQANLNDTLPLLTPALIDMSSYLSTITGIDTAPDGTLYILGHNSLAPTPFIYKYKPGPAFGSGSILLDYYNFQLTPITNTTDIMVRPPYIYVLTGYSGGPLMRIPINNYDLSSAIYFGSMPGDFFRPARFVGLRNGEMIIIDDSGNNNKLISLKYPSLTGWATASGAIGFEFYSVP